MSAQIPSTNGLDQLLRKVLDPMKENIETMKGRRRGIPKITSLPDTATSAEIIAKINEIIARIQG